MNCQHCYGFAMTGDHAASCSMQMTSTSNITSLWRIAEVRGTSSLDSLRYWLARFIAPRPRWEAIPDEPLNSSNYG